MKDKTASKGLSFRMPEDEAEEFQAMAGGNASEILRKLARRWMREKKAIKRGKSA